MVTSNLSLQSGARRVDRVELDAIPAPLPTRTWVPVAHGEVVDTALATLRQGGFDVRGVQYALSSRNARMFATVDLTAPVANGVSLAAGIRNSIDKSLPLGFCAGARVLVCDNLAFRAELMVHRKHTRFGRDRWTEAICEAVRHLHAFRETERCRIERLQDTPLGDDAANSYMLRAFERNLVSHTLLRRVIADWRNPPCADFAPRTKWSLLNAFTGALGGKRERNPQAHARLTMALQDLLEDSAALLPISQDATEEDADAA